MALRRDCTQVTGNECFSFGGSGGSYQNDFSAGAHGQLHTQIGTQRTEGLPDACSGLFFQSGKHCFRRTVEYGPDNADGQSAFDIGFVVDGGIAAYANNNKQYRK